MRPDPTAGNITQVESTARSSAHSVNIGFNMNHPWHRTFLFVNYGIGRWMNDTDGAFGLPADNFDLAAEWGASPMDVRHRVTGMF